jgi:esterase/lipase superfamily enzyme
MKRLVVLVFAALAFVWPGCLLAETQSNWVKINTIEIDPRVAGKASIDLSGADGKFRALRFSSNETVTVATVKTKGPSFSNTRMTSTLLKAGEASSPFYTGAKPDFLASVEIAWKANPTASGPIKIEVWGSQSSGEAAEVRPRANPRFSDGASGRDRSLPKPATTSDRRGDDEKARTQPESKEAGKPLPPTSERPGSAASPAPKSATASSKPDAPSSGGAGRGLGQSAPGNVPAAQPAPPVIVGAPSPAPQSPQTNVCTEKGVCTVVDVFFGTDRGQAPAPDRLNFSSDRANKLTLGHAFVTVPKAKRVQGSIPLPGLWDKYVRGVPAEGDPARHFTIPKNGISVYSTEEEFLSAAKTHIATAGDFKNHAFIFVHGFYVTFDNALYRTAQIAYDLSPDGRPFGTAFMYSWPSAGNATSYIYDQDSAQFSVPHLQSFIRTVADKTGVENIHIIAHSMGNVALIGALQEIAKTETTAKINQIILAAPDVDKAQFENVIAGVGKMAKGMTLYASQGDYALALARKARRGAARAGESVMPPGPAVAEGIDTIDVSAISTSIFSWGHDGYADSGELLADIAKLFTKGVHPPTMRSDRFKMLQQGTLAYWKYAK